MSNEQLGDSNKSNEDEIHVVGLFNIEELKNHSGEMENWSAHIINGL